jgi:hypothetical protein
MGKGNKSDVQALPCNHPNWSHMNDLKDFTNALAYLTLALGEDDAESAVSEFIDEQSNIGHYKPKDIIRAARLKLLPDDNPDVAQHIDMMKKGQKLSPPLVIVGTGKRPAIVAAGYHRTCAAYYDDMNMPIPCVVIDA